MLIKSRPKSLQHGIDKIPMATGIKLSPIFSGRANKTTRPLLQVLQDPQRLYARRFQINNWSRRFENDDIVRPLWRHKVNMFSFYLVNNKYTFNLKKRTVLR